MARAVMLSIRPQWCELIASGKKTIEVRKTVPKIDTPFKCYIYETKGKIERPRGDEDGYIYQEGSGAVIGEFVCDEIFKFSTRVYLGEEQKISDEELVSKSCVPRPELRDYEGRRFGLFGWHISDLKIYDKPKPLYDFLHTAWDGCVARVKRPPQSWMFVEDCLMFNRETLSALEAIDSFRLDLSKLCNASEAEQNKVVQWAMIKSLHSGRPVRSILSDIEMCIMRGETLDDIEKWMRKV